MNCWSKLSQKYKTVRLLVWTPTRNLFGAMGAVKFVTYPYIVPIHVLH